MTFALLSLSRKNILQVTNDKYGIEGMKAPLLAVNSVQVNAHGSINGRHNKYLVSFSPQQNTWVKFHYSSYLDENGQVSIREVF